MRFYFLIIFLAVGLYFCLRPAEIIETPETAMVSPHRQIKIETKENDQAKPTIVSITDNPPLIPTTDLTVGETMTARKNMAAMLKQLADCAEIKNTVPAGAAEPTLSSVLDSVQSEFGEPVIRSEDWASVEVKVADNSRKLIRVETVYEDDDIVKKLKYYQVTPSQLVPIQLSHDQTVNPSESFLASLEKEGETVGKEKSERVFFQNGEEISYIEKDGRIESSEIIKAGKSLKCSGYGQTSFRCQCF